MAKKPAPDSEFGSLPPAKKSSDQYFGTPKKAPAKKAPAKKAPAKKKPGKY